MGPTIQPLCPSRKARDKPTTDRNRAKWDNREPVGQAVTVGLGFEECSQWRYQCQRNLGGAGSPGSQRESLRTAPRPAKRLLRGFVTQENPRIVFGLRRLLPRVMCLSEEPEDD